MNFRNSYLNKKIRSLRNKIPIPPLIDQHDYRKSLFLAGTGRSGTTWLQEIMNYDNAYRMMFEPFYPEKVDIVSHWSPFQYLDSSNNEPKFLEPARAILSGNIRNNWVDKYNKRIISHYRIIKDIRANLMLYWIKERFSEIPIIMILRHPCAVANSKLQANWDSNLQFYLSQEKLIGDCLKNYESKMRDLKSNFEQHIFSWCIENFIPLKQFNGKNLFVIFYEDLCIDPEPEIRELFSFIDKPYKKKVNHFINKPSLETSKRSAIISGNDLITSWKKNITRKQIRKALKILSEFGLDQIYNDSGSPLITRKQLWGSNLFD